MQLPRITSRRIAFVLQKPLPFVTEDMAREWMEEGILPSWRNPFKKRGWYYAIPEAVEPFLLKLNLSPEQIREVLIELGINFKQLYLPLTA